LKFFFIILILISASVIPIDSFAQQEGVSVFGEYYKGTRTMAHVRAQYDSNDFWSNYETKGDFWNTGIGISYTFSKSK
jgi:hypothetical protein